MKRDQIWPIVIFASALGAGAAAFSPSDATLRTLLTTWFLLICPGMAVVPLIARAEHWIEIILAIAVSLVLNTVVAEGMLLLGAWSPLAGLALLIALSLGGAGLQFVCRQSLLD